jgi:hypothetical protein
MESHPYEKTPGEGAIVPASHPLTYCTDTSVCTFVNAKGGRCRMLTLSPEFPLCPDHMRKEALRQRRQQEALAKDLLSDIRHFTTADDINLFLGNLLRQMAHNRIDRKDAIAMAYVSQLLLNTLTPLRRQMERDDEQGDAEAFRLLRESLQRVQAQAAAEAKVTEGGAIA